MTRAAKFLLSKSNRVLVLCLAAGLLAACLSCSVGLFCAVSYAGNPVEPSLAAEGHYSAEELAPAGQSHKSGGSHHSPKPLHLFQLHRIPVTNAMVSSWLIALLIIAGAIMFNYAFSRGRMKAFTGVVELCVTSISGFFQDLVGEKLNRRIFWFIGALFFFILLINFAELIPGVGSIGWGKQTEHGFEIHKPLFRGAAADLNLTLALGALFFIYWLYLALRINGPLGFILHIFGFKGEADGFLRFTMVIVFIAVGFLEVISIIVRPFSLALRLYGNIFAGGILLETMMKKVPALAWLLPLPFYFMEALVAFVQAFVFALLSAIFIMLICDHGEEHGPESGPVAERGH